jgi:hypothetical protein
VCSGRTTRSTCKGGDAERSELPPAAGVERVRQQARIDGITLKRIRDLRIRAKVIAWDSDSIVVTSQNRLSADSMEATLATELGLAIECRRIADQLVGRIRHIVEPSWRTQRSADEKAQGTQPHGQCSKVTPLRDFPDWSRLISPIEATADRRSAEPQATMFTVLCDSRQVSLHARRTHQPLGTRIAAPCAHLVNQAGRRSSRQVYPGPGAATPPLGRSLDPKTSGAWPELLVGTQSDGKNNRRRKLVDNRLDGSWLHVWHHRERRKGALMLSRCTARRDTFRNISKGRPCTSARGSR